MPIRGKELVVLIVREWYHKITKFMFWAVFSWDWKRPCHYWKKETILEKKEAATKIAKMNAAIEPKVRAEWELSTVANQLRIDNNVLGQKP